MKFLKYILTIVCLVSVAFGVIACNVQTADAVKLDQINPMLKYNYKQIKLVVDTDNGGVKLTDTFAVTKAEGKLAVAVKLQRLATFDKDDSGNIVVPDSQIKEIVGSFDVVDGKIVNPSEGLDVSELPITAVDASGFNFSADCLTDVNTGANKLTANVSDVAKFVGVPDFDGKDMTTEVKFGFGSDGLSRNLQEIVVKYVTAGGINASFTFTFTA